MKIPIYHDPGFEAPLGEHIMPIRKFALVAAELAKLDGFDLRRPDSVSEEDFLRVHTRDYLRAVQTGQPLALAESQKFPWSPELYASVALTSGGLVAASLAALNEIGVAGALASGFHHACPTHGEGFCTFNGLVVSLEKLRAAGTIRTAAVLDMDLHYGNGTAILAESRDWLFALSIYGNDYWENVPYRDVDIVRHPAGPNHNSVPLPNGADGPQMLEILEASLPRLLDRGRPDILLYQAGADPLRDDPYSPLDLGHDDLFARDRRVFAFAREHGIPIAWVLAGGYTKDTSQVVRVHVNTALAAREIFG